MTSSSTPRHTTADALREGARAALLSGARGLALCFLSLGASLALLVLNVVSLALIPALLGLFTTPPVIALTRAHANGRRLLAHAWAGLAVPPPYRPLPRTGPGPLRTPRRCLRLLADPATWRDLLWLPADAVAGFVCALLPPALIVYGAEGWVILAGVWRAVQGGYWYAFIPVEGPRTAVLCAALGTALLAAAVRLGPLCVRAHFGIARGMIAPTREARLEQRVAELYETRHEAVDSSAAQLRRIERDLHDGAQARLVSMGMSLGTVEALIERDPAEAKRLLAEARRNSAEALTELRDLVRGIHPPVLAERGLGDAVEALALRMPMPVETDIDLPGRFPEPVESAAYFAISEALTNAAKHSGADRVWLDMHYDQTLRIAITDNGKGGAEPPKALQRRLSPLDGILAVTSPKGGPTMLTMEIPTEPAPT
ncbi:histidine kinase [Streptomyces sp. ODS28]|uniref:sensor histidine kinase n=1 Tax=Streptomyces sp. ODS28 TaxID=3136688 RepID=UPI0031F1272B